MVEALGCRWRRDRTRQACAVALWLMFGALSLAGLSGCASSSGGFGAADATPAPETASLAEAPRALRSEATGETAREEVSATGPAPYTLRISGSRPADNGSDRVTFAFAAADLAAGPVAAQSAKGRPFDVIQVLWGTDRTIEGGGVADGETAVRRPVIASLLPPAPVEAPPPRLGSGRGSELVLGAADVTIPSAARTRGTIPRPARYAILNVDLYRESESPAKHFTLLNLDQLGREAFSSRANAILGGAARFKDQVLVFVHGYNTSFDEALFRTAQIAHDIGFDGLAAMYSWPSRATSVDYSYDLNSAVRAQTYFIEFLNRIAITSRAARIHLIGHSLGNRPLLEALRTLQRSGNYAVVRKIGRVVFAAPDVDRDLFAEIASGLEIGQGRTLYASANDKALLLSRQLDGVPRAGDVPRAGPLVVKGVETIDISAAGSRSFWAANHNLYAERSDILDDIRLLLQGDSRPPHERMGTFKTVTAKAGRYWTYKP